MEVRDMRSNWLVFGFVFVALAALSGALAQEDGTETNVSLPDPDITPDSPFWAFDRFFERIDLFLTFDKAEHAKKGLTNARERIAEVDYCVLTADSDKEAITMTKRLILEIPSLKGKLMVMVDSKSSAEKLKESDLLIDTFVPSEGVIDAFIKDKTTQK